MAAEQRMAYSWVLLVRVLPYWLSSAHDLVYSASGEDFHQAQAEGLCSDRVEAPLRLVIWGFSAHTHEVVSGLLQRFAMAGCDTCLALCLEDTVLQVEVRELWSSVVAVHRQRGGQVLVGEEVYSSLS